MSRAFPDFLKAYEEYAADGHTPSQFNTWSALSIIAGALERRVWLPWNDTYSFYPNIYVMLISRPGVGKSTGLTKAVELLEQMNRKTSTLNIMPQQVTEAKFLEMMGNGRSFLDTSSGKEIIVYQNAGYYYASEASNSLRNLFGDFISALTIFYDCPTSFAKATIKGGKPINLKNVCMNIIAGSTFDYLGKLVSDENIQGGFASRLIYVQHNDIVVREPKWPNMDNPEHKRQRDEYRLALMDDLIEINRMTGPFKGTPEFGKAWETWFPKFERYRQSLKSEKLQSVISRTNTNVLKLSMLISAAESNDRLLKIHHWERAVELIEGVNAQIPGIFIESRANQAPGKCGNGLANFIIRHVMKHNSSATVENTKHAAVNAGHNAMATAHTVEALLGAGMLGRGAAIAGEGVRIVIKGNPNDYL